MLHRRPLHAVAGPGARRDGKRYPWSTSDAARQIIEDALRLPLDERATVVAELIASIDGAPDADADEAWNAEIERRALRALRGESTGRDWASVRTDLETKHDLK
jgi:hypothetical protein